MEIWWSVSKVAGYNAKLVEQIHMNVTGVLQKVKHSSLKTVPSGTSPNLCTVYIRSQFCSQICTVYYYSEAGLHIGTLLSEFGSTSPDTEHHWLCLHQTIKAHSVCHESQGPGQRGRALLPLHRGKRGWTSVTACTTEKYIGIRTGSWWIRSISCMRS